MIIMVITHASMQSWLMRALPLLCIFQPRILFPLVRVDASDFQASASFLILAMRFPT